MKKRSFLKTALGLSFLALMLSACGEAAPSSEATTAEQSTAGQSNSGQSGGGQSQQTSQKTEDVDAQIHQIYELYVQSGGTMTYEEWLASIKGKDGVSIVAVEKTGSDGLTDTYTIRFSDGTSTQFTVTNGNAAYSCTILPSEHGYVSVNLGSAFVGDDVTFLIHPEEDYSIAHLYLNEVDVVEQMTNPLSYTTKMVKNGFVVRALFEINRRVTPEVFKHEITDMGMITDEKGFTMEYTVDVKGGGSSNWVKIQKSGGYIKYEAGPSSSSDYKSESLLVKEEDGTYTAYYFNSEKWKKSTSGIEEEMIWNQLIPGFTTLAKFDYTYNPNTGYYESKNEKVPGDIMPGSAEVTNFDVSLGFRGNHCNEFFISFDQGNGGQYSYHIDVKGTAYDYDGKTVIDPKWVAEVIDEASRFEVKIVISSAEETVTRALIDEYRKENPGDLFDVTFSTIEPTSALYENEGGDIYWFAQDQLTRFVDADFLSPLDSKTKANVVANNVANSITGATIGDTLYAYPMTADNGCFLYYDKSLISANHLTDLASILNDCAKRSRTFAMEATSAWFNASFFFGTGCHSVWTGSAQSGFESCDDNYYSPEGIVALKGLSILVNSSAYDCASSFSAASSDVGALVSGTWEYNNAKQVFGSNLGCAALPSFTVEGKTYHMGSFFGCKYLGVRPQSDPDKEALCHRLANYLTSYDAQLKRLEVLGYGPTNLEATKSSLMSENPALQALYQQLDYSTPQGQYPGSWWNIAGKLAPKVSSLGSNPDDEDLKDILFAYNEAINDIAPNTNPTPTFPSGDEEPPAPEPETVVYTITGLPNWVANDGATVFAWTWGGEEEKWVKVKLGTPGTGGATAKELSATVELLKTRIGFNLARCVMGTTKPDWTATGDSTGRVYNKTGDVDIVAGKTSYTCPAWEEYDPEA